MKDILIEFFKEYILCDRSKNDKEYILLLIFVHQDHFGQGISSWLKDTMAGRKTGIVLSGRNFVMVLLWAQILSQFFVTKRQ
jgi:hypothetical protein